MSCLLTNHRRIALAMDMAPDTHVKVLIEEYLRRTATPIKPVLVKDGPCKENIDIGDKVDLLKFPVPMVHDGDGGRFIGSWHVDINKDPDSDWVNWGMYRAVIQTRNTLGGLVWPFQHIGMHYYKSEARNQTAENSKNLSRSHTQKRLSKLVNA